MVELVRAEAPGGDDLLARATPSVLDGDAPKSGAGLEDAVARHLGPASKAEADPRCSLWELGPGADIARRAEAIAIGVGARVARVAEAVLVLVTLVVREDRGVVDDLADAVVVGVVFDVERADVGLVADEVAVGVGVKQTQVDAIADPVVVAVVERVRRAWVRAVARAVTIGVVGDVVRAGVACVGRAVTVAVGVVVASRADVRTVEDAVAIGIRIGDAAAAAAGCLFGGVVQARVDAIGITIAIAVAVGGATATCSGSVLSGSSAHPSTQSATVSPSLSGAGTPSAE